ncbi:hypothetical protein HYQ46_013334 [Verticillium longisporum]|nr:hypothetical protein HYQ46_013334 [Verticillium longisporum]
MSAVPKTNIKDETPKVSAQRLKKRELDRKAQRVARERTRSRIAHLEELVGHLSQDNTNAEVSHLMERLLRRTQERDKLFGVLASLSTTIRHHIDTMTASQADESSSVVVAAMQAPSNRSERDLNERVFNVSPVDRQAQAQAQVRAHDHSSLTTSPEHHERPGIRDRFVFSQHRYCMNEFWNLFRLNLKLVWQLGFNACFIQNTTTGRFGLAPLFEERIRNIKAWTMNADILNQYPELADDIPLFTDMSAKPSTPQIALAQQQVRCGITPRPIKRDVDEPAELMPQQQQQRQQAKDDLTKSSALAFADNECMLQSPNVHVTKAGGAAGPKLVLQLALSEMLDA